MLNINPTTAVLLLSEFVKLKPTKIRAALTEATKVVASGKLTLPITTTYKMSQIKEAIGHSQRGGKVLLDFNRQN